METIKNIRLNIRNAVYVEGISPEELRDMLSYGTSRKYQAGEWLFHESTPREWAGIVMDGELEIVRGLHGETRHIATIDTGALVAESTFFDQSAHANGCFTRHGATIWQLSVEKIETIRKENPDLFYTLLGRIAVTINRRLKMQVDETSDSSINKQILAGLRIEYDSLGSRAVPADAYYGVQTLRAKENFQISGVFVKNFRHMVEAFAMVKKAAALTNNELKALDESKAHAICRACDDLLAGKYHDQFIVDMFQGGAGTSTNMNANEVIANRGLELMGKDKGCYEFLHPNDDVNQSQSTNDTYPTAIKIAVILSLNELLATMKELKLALERKAEEFDDVLKMGRTENQDAVPMTLGQEFSAYAVMVASAMRALENSSQELYAINMGATAIGTGLNSPPQYADLVTQKLAEISGIPLRRAENLVEATQNAGSFAQMSATMKRAAVQISKICNDLRWMSSGPRCGLNEINLPPMQPGSSIMPGKVNPVIPELVNQICYQIIGYDNVVSMAAEASELELCMAEPIIAYDLLHGLLILKNGVITLVSRCIYGITANREQCSDYVKNSIGLVTALVPVLGYERSAAIAKEALKTGSSVYDLILGKGWLSKEELDNLLKPENMTDPREIQ